MLDISKMKHIGLFAGGVLFGTAGEEALHQLLSSRFKSKRERYDYRYQYPGECW